jgi:hypothetical protein
MITKYMSVTNIWIMVKKWMTMNGLHYDGIEHIGMIMSVWYEWT